MPKDNSEKRLWWLQEIGLDVRDNSSVEWTCVCPFCGDEGDHFHFNSHRLVYDCKKCGAQGNYLPLLAQLTINLAEEFDDKGLSILAEDRHLPEEAFDGYSFGWTGELFTLPIRDAAGKLMNVLRYIPGNKPRSAPGCRMGLFNAQDLADPARGDEPVYLVEGPWDAIALDWLRRKVEREGIVTAVLGAGHLPDALVGLFRGQEVRVIHDNDDAGAKGEARIAAKLTGMARSLTFFQWADSDTPGTDVRDIIVGAM